MDGLKIVGMAVVAAVLFGIVHDQVTARVCVEYFTIGHPPIFHTESPTLLGLGWGVIATWWAGALVGVPLAACARWGGWPRIAAADLCRPIAWLLAAMAAASLAFGILGYCFGEPSPERLAGFIPAAVPPARWPAFFADGCAHMAAYAVGFLGGLVLCVWTLVRRAYLGGRRDACR